MDISSLLEVQVNEVQPSVALDSTDTVLAEDKPKLPILRPSQIVSHEEAAFFKRMFGNDVAQVRFRPLHCTSCDVHIGSAPADSPNMHEHPVIKTLLCSSCRMFYGDGDFEQGDDATDMFCRWCANGGNLYCCSYCSNTFCEKCIMRNFEADVREKIEADEKWKCFVCDPRDLYIQRSVCRALLQHIRTVARILVSDRNITQKELEERMELDDSKCCFGKRSRQRKRQMSISNDDDDDDDEDDDDYDDKNEDEDYNAHTDGTIVQHRNRKNRVKNGSSQKRRKSTSSARDSSSKSLTLNGTSRFIPIAPKYILQEMVPANEKLTLDEADDIPTPLLHCEQTMIECENQTVTPQGIILPLTHLNSNIPESILNNSAISLNPLPKPNILRTTNRPIALRPLHKLHPIPPGTKIHRIPANVPMVTIPARPPIYNINLQKNSSTEQSNQLSNYLKSAVNVTTPSVIDIDSDGDEQQAVDVGNNDTDNLAVDDNEASTKLKQSKFENTLDNPLKPIDNILEKLRERLRLDFETINIDNENEVINKRKKITIINRNVKNIVKELTAFNNSMVDKYKPWKNCHDHDEQYDDSTKIIILKKNEHTNKFGDLDLECECDSESEEECEDDDGIDVDSLLTFSARIKKISDIKDSITQGTMAKIETEDKAIQVHGPLPDDIDFDKTIGYSLLMRADYDYKENKEVYKPVVIHDQNFGKYEEQFIFYLQVLEDRKNNAEDAKDEHPDVLLTDLIDRDLSHASQLMNDDCEDPINSTTDVSTSTNTSVTTTTPNNSIHIEDESSPLSSINDKSSTDKNIVEITSSTPEKLLNDNDKHDDAKDDTGVKINYELGKQTSNQEIKPDETVIAVNALIEEERSAEQLNTWKNPQGDDECTILD